jgi:glycogen synthase
MDSGSAKPSGLGDVPLVVFLGKITPRKRVGCPETRVRALEGRAHLVIAGNDMGGLTEMTLWPAEAVHFRSTALHGLVSGRDRFDVLAAADVMVYPGEDEIFGLVPMEALLCGAPVVVAGGLGLRRSDSSHRRRPCGPRWRRTRTGVSDDPHSHPPAAWRAAARTAGRERAR